MMTDEVVFCDDDGLLYYGVHYYSSMLSSSSSSCRHCLCCFLLFFRVNCGCWVNSIQEYIIIILYVVFPRTLTLQEHDKSIYNIF